MIKKEDIKKLYKGSDKRAISFMENIVVGMGGNIPDYIQTNLDLLSTQLSIYYKAKDIMENEPLITTTQKGPRQNPALDVMQRAHSRILEILKESGITKNSKARIKRLDTQQTQETSALIERLTQ